MLSAVDADAGPGERLTKARAAARSRVEGVYKVCNVWKRTLVVAHGNSTVVRSTEQQVDHRDQIKARRKLTGSQAHRPSDVRRVASFCVCPHNDTTHDNDTSEGEAPSGVNPR